MDIFSLCMKKLGDREMWWKCLNCAHLSHDDYQEWDNGPDFSPDITLENLTCSEQVFFLNCLELKKLEEVFKKTYHCIFFKQKIKE